MFEIPHKHAQQAPSLGHPKQWFPRWQCLHRSFLCLRENFVVQGEQGQAVVGDMLMKGIRGGAYDTYFAWQATGTFRSGLACLVRSHNVGFRCAMDLPSE